MSVAPQDAGVGAQAGATHRPYGTVPVPVSFAAVRTCPRASAGRGVVIQPALGKTADVWGYPNSYVAAANFDGV